MAEGHDGGIGCIGFLPRHSEPVTDVTGVGIRSPFLCLRRPLFFQQRKKRGKETPSKTTFLDFLTRLRPQLISLVLPRERCAVEISPKCCIVSASLFAAAFALKYRSNRFYRGRDQRQRRRRKDDPFVRTTKSSSRDRAVKTTNNNRA